MNSRRNIIVKGANENNLKDLSVSIPHNSFTVITGVSGSGKSSLAYDIIFRESQRRYLASFSSYSRQYISNLRKPNAESIKGLPPALAIGQYRNNSNNPRSTAGTISGLYDLIRLLFARYGKANCLNCNTSLDRNQTLCPECNTKRPDQLSRLFSFNSKYGACPNCNGLGKTEQIDPDKLISNPGLTLRQGALVPTTPTGYIVYSQVRVEELDKVCQAHGFSVDIPWNKLTQEQQDVVLRGSSKVKILFGKHSLESRLKWKGITALPRTESYYKGMLPIMTDILNKDRNDNILRFVSAYECKQCNGSRLRNEARKVIFMGKSIDEVNSSSISLIKTFFQKAVNKEKYKPVIDPIISKLKTLELLGLGYITINRGADSMSGGEIQRLKLASLMGSKMQNILFLFDEPTIGLHPADTGKLIKALKDLRNNNNTVLVVEHNDVVIHSADYLIDIGPKAGSSGGKLLFAGSPRDYVLDPVNQSYNTFKYYFEKQEKSLNRKPRKATGEFNILGATKYNLKNIDVSFKSGSFNVVTGVSGAGKSTLVNEILGNKLINKEAECKGFHSDIKISQVVRINQSPIGRTPRSNPATYTGVFDLIRDIFSKTPTSIDKGLKKGHFSFNNKEGRCNTCQGRGSIELGMHMFGKIEQTCDSCNGSRYNNEVIEVVYEGYNIAEILDLSIDEAASFLEHIPKIHRILSVMSSLGIGYLKLGQSATTLSGGEAQRVKLSSELYKVSKGHNVYILDEPSTGLHRYDTNYLLKALNQIVDNNNTVVVIEHDTQIIEQADYVIDLGPEGGENGGDVVVAGTPYEISKNQNSLTAKYLKNQNHTYYEERDVVDQYQSIKFNGVRTNNLKGISIEIPLNKTTVITGVSGSGKSSLAFDTVYSESQTRFTEGFNSYARRMMKKVRRPELEDCSGLTPSFAIGQKQSVHNPRSTVGTMTEIYDLYRLLYSRLSKNNRDNSRLPASMFSFNNQEAACPVCNGAGEIEQANSDVFISNPELSLINGAMKGSSPGRFFSNPDGKHISILNSVAKHYGININLPWNELDHDEKEIILFGTGDKEYGITWNFKRGQRTGVHSLVSTWDGMVNYLTEDYLIKKGGKRSEIYDGLIALINCRGCDGDRLQKLPLSYRIVDFNISELTNLTVDQSIEFFDRLPKYINSDQISAATTITAELLPMLRKINDIGLGYLQLKRSSSSLSGGEHQRLRIVSQLISGLTGVTYILDEPTKGLHHNDTKRLLDSLNELKSDNNTIVLVEHDPEIIRTADHIIDMGPGAGYNGGNIIASGSPLDIMNNPESSTGLFLKKHNHRIRKQLPPPDNFLSVSEAKARNLKAIDIRIPYGRLTSITGVSGSGKTSLVKEVILSSLKHCLPVNCSYISRNYFNHVKNIDQSQIVSSSISIIATYLSIYDRIRTLFAASIPAKEMGFGKSHFSFTNKETQCPECKGNGMTKISLDFLSDVWTQCDVCGGKRFKDLILDLKLKGLNISQILELHASEAIEFFSDDKEIRHSLQLLEELGLDYLKLGQHTSTLSGGESQRLKLVSDLLSARENNTLYLFDEPSTGLHMYDVEVLIRLFDKLVKAGNTVVVIEHNLQIVQSSDWNIELGPVGGDDGGYLVNMGTVK